jgi:hypothetical protein
MQMDSNQSSDSSLNCIWKFVRGDMLTSDFEQWAYSDPTVETLLGKELYFELISTDFSSKDAVFCIKQSLKSFAISVSNCTCMCIQLSDTAVVDMGEESEKVFLTLKEIRRRGDPYWWLSVHQCQACQQSWLVAQEERQNDVFCLYRIDNDTMKDVLNNNHWPSVFDHYESLLCIGLEAGRSVRWVDPLNSSDLRWTISDLAKDKPGISISEIAELLNLDIGLAEELARRAVQEDHVRVSFNKPSCT